MHLCKRAGIRLTCETSGYCYSVNKKGTQKLVQCFLQQNTFNSSRGNALLIVIVREDLHEHWSLIVTISTRATEYNYLH